MSKYTTEVRFICEHSAGKTESAGYSSVDEILNLACPVIFDFDFPIYDEAYRVVLEKKILKHYYTREIGLETVGLWKLKLDTKMNEIMPYYNKLYQVAVANFNPLYDTDLTTTHILKKVESTSSETNNTLDTTSTDYKLFSDTPQGGLNGVDNQDYLTNITKNTSDNELAGNTQFEESVGSTDDYVQHVTGKSAGVSYGKLIKEFKDSLMNVDMMIIDELKDLFFNLW